MASVKQSQHHIALDGLGYIMAGSPTSPARSMSQQPVFGNRFASGDRDYTDFSLFWYWAQTDWLGGFKDDKEWADDTMYYYSTNIDAFTEQGAFTLSLDITQEVASVGSLNFISTGIYGSAERVSGTIATEHFLGDGREPSGAQGLWYKVSDGDGWTNLVNYGTNDRGMVTQILIHKNKIFKSNFCSARSTLTYQSSTLVFFCEAPENFRGGSGMHFVGVRLCREGGG